VAFVVSVFSHSSRSAILSRTLQSFADVGVPVDHVEVQIDRPKAAHNRRNAWMALKRSVEVVGRKLPNMSGVLLIEDDVTPSPHLLEWMKYLDLYEERVTTLYCPIERVYPHRYKSFIKGTSRKDPVPAVVAVSDIRAWWGSQALWIPLPWARVFKNDQRMQVFEHGLGPWDHAVRTIMIEHNATMGLVVPNVIQHNGEPNVVNPTKRTHRSQAYRPDAMPPSVAREVDY